MPPPVLEIWASSTLSQCLATISVNVGWNRGFASARLRRRSSSHASVTSGLRSLHGRTRTCMLRSYLPRTPTGISQSTPPVNFRCTDVAGQMRPKHQEPGLYGIGKGWTLLLIPLLAIRFPRDSRRRVGCRADHRSRPGLSNSASDHYDDFGEDNIAHYSGSDNNARDTGTDNNAHGSNRPVRSSYAAGMQSLERELLRREPELQPARRRRSRGLRSKPTIRSNASVSFL